MNHVKEKEERPFSPSRFHLRAQIFIDRETSGFKLHLGVEVMSVPRCLAMFDGFCWLCCCQVASQVAALDLGYKPGVDKMAEKPKLLFLLGAVSFLIMGIHKGQLSIDFPPEQNTRGSITCIGIHL